MHSYRKTLGSLSLTALCLSVAAQTASPQYDARGDPPTGSAIRSTYASGGNLPINKRYDEFTVEEKETLNQFYEKMGPGDEPPFPAYGLKPIYTALARIQGELRVRGELYLFATVDQDGKVVQVKALGNPDPEMTKLAATVLSLTRFKPALCKGVPCTMDYPFRLNFK